MFEMFALKSFKWISNIYKLYKGNNIIYLLQKKYSTCFRHRRSCYRQWGQKPPWQVKELVYQEPESIEVLILIQGISSWCLEGYHFQLNACLCLLLYERHFQPACLSLAVNHYQSYYQMFFLSKIYIRESYWMWVNFQCFTWVPVMKLQWIVLN